MRAEVAAMRFMLVLPLVLVGCATAPTPAAVAIQDADQKAVEACRYVGNVTGESLIGGFTMQMVGRNNAVAEARNTAAEIGATHIVWNYIDSNAYGASASGSAYRCGA